MFSPCGARLGYAARWGLPVIHFLSAENSQSFCYQRLARDVPFFYPESLPLHQQWALLPAAQKGGKGSSNQPKDGCSHHCLPTACTCCHQTGAPPGSSSCVWDLILSDLILSAFCLLGIPHNFYCTDYILIFLCYVYHLEHIYLA